MKTNLIEETPGDRPGPELVSGPVSGDALRSARILFMIDSMQSITDGGTERQLLQMIQFSKHAGMLPQVCVLRGTQWLTEELAGCPVTRFSLEKLLSWQGLRSLARLARWMRGQKFDILQNFFSEANLVGPWVGRLAGIRVILGTRRNLNHPRREDPNGLGLRAQAISNLLVNMVIANSGAVLERIVESESISRKRICVVYNGIDLDHMRPLPHLRRLMRESLGLEEGQVLVGNVSGLRKIKGVELFVNAAATAYRSDGRLRFVLVGEGELKSQLEQLIRAYGLEGIIQLPGPAEDVRPYLAAFDIAVLCSHAEGFSNSLLEYMASGVPVIATDVGGNREALGDCGLLVSAKPDELAEAIREMSAPEVRERFTGRALARVRNFDVSIAQERTIELYRQYLTGTARKRHGYMQFVAHPPERSLKIE